MFKRDAVAKNLQQVWERVSDEVKADYGEEYLQALTDMLGSTADHSSSNLGPVSEAITDGLTLKHPRERYMPAGIMWKIMVWAFDFLPAGLMDNLIRLVEILLIKKSPKNRSKLE